ncbi:unnamed protein product [Caenorhabditis sp. 36 PRJEB53466]|nr:unnamed protein product [Caenorhabditis sp. 36 PRJEB53466]
MAFLMQPITLFPLRSGYSVGVLATYFGFTSHQLMTVLSFLFSFQINTLSVCFLRKHQVLARLGHKYELSPQVYAFFMFAFYAFAVTFAVVFNLAGVREDEIYNIILQDYPQFLSQFMHIREFALYKLNPMLIAWFSMAILGCLQTGITVSVLVFQMFSILLEQRLHLSKSTLEKHRVALWSLIVQFFVAPIGVLPEMLIILTVVIEFKYAQIFTWFGLMVMTTHSIINSLVVIFTFPEFRAIVIFWNRNGSKTRLTASGRGPQVVWDLSSATRQHSNQTQTFMT